ncbi:MULTISPECIES: Asp23/Gls24 family envelope stress response protein [unclassified Sedimentibacter]|uniref:Asp23/Gls24 family envelope stress response protein n=1 Tax=unclassified Sedimentibacter TaxID=2649220 RepID=UPI0027E13F3F|nr:Asp23/Gls24 family envelope stress response protein [Sedimentibacter sp. MB35-C1]WMJ76086.1 Asp23/Gls24 family envelope stress response protein [Sedimentibacter sp. MB35-C1]
MSVNVLNENGNIIIDDQVFATLAGLAAMECYGVVGMASRNATQGIFELLKREQLTKGIKVTTVDEKINIDLYIVLQYGVKISVVADNIISRIKYSVETFSGVSVENVNIFVQGVRVQK